MGPVEVRRRLGIIPQEPILFSGSLRDNLDAAHLRRDKDLLEVLSQVQLDRLVEGLPAGLDTRMEDMLTLSHGQRQLLCICRALVDCTVILVCDEPTAQVDGETDLAVQFLIRKLFTHSTVLTIAHRLSSILDSDKILVMGNGSVLEFDTPETLLSDPSSAFSSMLSTQE